MVSLYAALWTTCWAPIAERAHSAEPAARSPEPTTLTVRYTVAVDLDPRADQVCGLTGFCDCKMVYEGSGANPRRGQDIITFEGPWKVVSNTCHEVFSLWSSEGQAHHTLRLGADGATITEWLAHRDPGTTRVAGDFKKNGQVFLEPMKLAWRLGSPMVHTESDTQVLSGLSVSTTHTLTLTLGP